MRTNQLLHDNISIKLALLFGLDFLRESEADADLEPDLVLFKGGKRVLMEVCTGHEPYAWVVDNRFIKYAETTIPVCWVSCGLTSTSDVTRTRGLRVRSRGYGNLWFTPLTRVLEAPWDRVWQNHAGDVRCIDELWE